SVSERSRSGEGDYWEETQWERYVNGEILYDISDVRVANTIKTWLEGETPRLTREKVQQWLSDIQRWSLLIAERKCDKINANLYEHLEEVISILVGCTENLVTLWTLSTMKLTSILERKNEMTSTNEFINLSFWQLSSERKNKMLFFPGIQIEVTTFLQSVRVISTHDVFTEELEHFFSIADAEYLYHFDYMDPKKEEKDEETGSLRSKKSINLTTPRKSSSVRRISKMSESTSSSLLAKLRRLNIDTKRVAVPKKKPAPKKKVKKKTVKMRTGEEVKAALLAETTSVSHPTYVPISNVEETAESIMAATHLIDLKNESMIGQVYHIKSYNTFSRKKQSGAWLVHTEKEMDPFELTGELLLVSLKVPVEEVFMGPVEPTMAFQEEEGGTWKKGVFTTHTQFDQNTFVMSTRLSKFGKIALFQCNDFHFPYRKWSTQFHRDAVIFHLHTSTVALSFQFENHTIMLETQTGDEFSKLRSLHGKKLSLQEMAIQMNRHGVYIFPNESILRKHKGQVKMQVAKVGTNSYEISYGQDTGGMHPKEKTTCRATLSNRKRTAWSKLLGSWLKGLATGGGCILLGGKRESRVSVLASLLFSETTRRRL
ncbi:hypothetical protein PMAYCL1PPCAC_30779, partial [Pristionchus mayeri]